MPPALVADLVAAALEAGCAPRVAVLVVAEALEEAADPLAGPLVALAACLDPPGWGALRTDGPFAPLAQALHLAQDTGLAPAELVRRAAEDTRRAQAASAARAAARLPVLLVLPVGLCLLPAAVLLGVVPVVLDLLLDVASHLR